MDTMNPTDNMDCVDACQPPQSSSSLRDTARAFVQAMIARDINTVQKLSRGTHVGFPPRYVLNRFGVVYDNRSLSELTFVVEETENRVSVRCQNQRLGDDLKFKKLGSEYFFSHYDCF